MSLADYPIQFIDLQAQRKLIQSQIDQALQKVLAHGQFILGLEVTELEAQLQAYTGAPHAITCASGTDALKLLLLAKSVKANDVVFVPAFTFAATAEIVADIGAIPYFVDIEEDSFNMDPHSLQAAIQEAKKNGLTLKGVIAVDLFGLPANYPVLEDIAAKENLFLIADAAQSFGGKIGSKRVGALTQMTATSFFPSKPLGGYGDGGCLFTEDDDVAKKIRSLRVHGAGEHRYDHIYVGMNSRLDTMQAAILLQKLSLFEAEYQRRQEIAAYYETHLSGLVATPAIRAPFESGFGLYTLKVPKALRENMITLLASEKIPSAVYYKKPLHQQSAYAHFPRVQGRLPVTDKVSEEVLSIPMHPYLNQEALEKIVSVIRHILS